MSTASQPGVLRFLDAELDLRRFELRRQGAPVRLEKLPMDLLTLLVNRQGQLLTREEIISALWGPGVFVDSDQGINTAIRKIRRALGDSPDAPRFVETVIGRGYRFVPPVERDVERDPGTQPAEAVRPLPPRRPLSRTGRLVILGAAAVLLLASLAAAWHWLAPARATVAAGRIDSIAVLPFDEIGSDTTYLSDGVTDALITTLARAGGLRVISRTSALQFRRPRQPLPEIARLLGADAVVEGTVQRVADRVHIRAQLIEASSDKHLWAEAYDRPIVDVFGVEEDLARTIAREIGRALGTGSSAGAARVPVEALDAYLLGRQQWARRNEEGLTASLALFRDCLETAPSFAGAYGGLADAYASLGYLGYLAPADAFEPAEAAARRALAIEPNLAEAHASLGYVWLYYRWNWAEAAREFDRAIASNPGYAPAYQWRAAYLAARGRLDESAASLERARAADPLSMAVATDIGWERYLRRDYEGAASRLSAVTAVDPNFPLAHFWLGRTLLQQGRAGEALSEFSRAVELLNRSPVALVQLAHAYAVAGHAERARALLKELDGLARTRYVPAYGYALIHAALGQQALALDWLERAVAERSNWLVWLNLDPRWDAVRGDPRFKVIVDRVGLNR